MEVSMMCHSEKRLIDANELTDRLNHTTMIAYPNLFPGLLAAVEVVDDSPTVDAVEVVHGRWLEFDTFMTCSECNKDFYYADNNCDEFDYCPNCGAKMDGDGNGVQ